MAVTDGKKGALHGDGQIDPRALAGAPVVDVAAEVSGRNGIDHVGVCGRYGNEAEVRTCGNANAGKRLIDPADGGVIDGNARVIHGPVHDPEGVSLRRPLKVINRLRPVLFCVSVQFVNCNDLTIFWLSD